MRSVFLLCCVFASCVLRAGDYNGEEFDYYISGGDEITIYRIHTSVSDIEIPSQIDGYPVWAVSLHESPSNLHSIIIPSTVEFIDGFEDCENLESFIIMPGGTPRRRFSSKPKP